MKNNQKAQSTLEYLILIGAVIGVLLVFMGAENSIFRNNVRETYNSVLDSMSTVAETLTESWQQNNN